jgi:hypothetical protein
VLCRSFDTTPIHQIIINGEEPIRAPAADPLGHLVKHGATNTVVARFVAEYLMPLDALIRKVGHAMHPFPLGCAFLNSYQVIEGHMRLNEAFATCMREGRMDVTIDPLALFVLGGAVDSEITNVFCNDLRYEFMGTIEMQGFYGDSNRFGRAGFLANQKELDYLIKRHDSDGGLFSRPRYPAAKFIRMLTALRETLTILAREPIMVETGTYRPRLQTQIQTFQDRENQIARDLANATNYTCRVKLVSGEEYVITTRPPQETLTGAALTERIQTIKKHMQALGVIRHYTEVERDIRARHQWLLDGPEDTDLSADRQGEPLPSGSFSLE